MESVVRVFKNLIAQDYEAAIIEVGAIIDTVVTGANNSFIHIVTALYLLGRVAYFFYSKYVSLKKEHSEALSAEIDTQIKLAQLKKWDMLNVDVGHEEEVEKLKKLREQLWKK